MVYDDDEIRRHLKAERARGKRPPISEAAAKKLLIQKQVVRNLLAERNFNKFLQRLSDIGLRVGSKDHQDCVDAWLDHRRGQR
jgi:hypothetical protein